MVDHSSYNITTYIEKMRKKEKRERKVNYQDLITEELLSSDFFIKGKCPRVKLEESNEVIKRLLIEIPVVIIPSTLMKDMTS